MRPIIKKKIATFYPQGFIDTNNAYSFITNDDIILIKKSDATMVLVSLKKVIFFNINGMSIILENLSKLKKEVNLTIGFCDYKRIQYETLLRFFKKDMNFSLFVNWRVASLFNQTQQSDGSGSRNILVWTQDQEQKNIIPVELYERGYNPIIVHKHEDFLDHKRNKKDFYEEIVYETYLSSLGDNLSARTVKNSVIYPLVGYLGIKTLEQSFDHASHSNSLQMGFKLFIFDLKKVISMNIYAVEFFENLVNEAKRHRANIVIANFNEKGSLKNFRPKLERVGVSFYKSVDTITNDEELMKELGGIQKVSVQKKRQLTRILINQLPSFANATVSSLEMMTGLKAVKQSDIKIKDLEVTKQEDKIASSIGFYGDIDGIIVLVFPKAIAKKACSILVNEDIQDMKDVLDTLGEFVNIIAGRVKYLLFEQDIKITITLPRNYATIDELFDALSINKGVQVDLSFNSDIFTFFLTR
jgi:CheY-specific phosphatase CheX